MKIKMILARLALALSLATIPALTNNVSVQAQQFTAYTAGVQIANLEATAAQITITAYKTSDGTQDGSPLSDSIPANDSKTYFPISNVSAGFQGSLVVSSSKKVAAIANVLEAGFKAGASYVGLSSGSTSVRLPLLMKNNNNINTWYSVQNAGSADATVTVNYSDGTNNSATVKPGAAKTFFQAQENHTQAVFAGTITSNQPLVAAAIQESTKEMFAYTAFATGTNNPVFPLVNANNSKIITGIQIQNAGTADTSVEVSYTPSLAGTACKETQTVKPGASATFALLAFANGANSNCTAGSRFIGSATVTANSTSQPLVGIANQLLPGVNGESYGSFAASDATNKVVAPLIMDRNNGYFTGISVANVGGPAATVTCTFSKSSFTIVKALAPGEALTELQQGKIADKYVGSATCTADNASTKIVGIVNQLGPSSTADQLLVYEMVTVQ